MEKLPIKIKYYFASMICKSKGLNHDETKDFLEYFFKNKPSFINLITSPSDILKEITRE
jgi:hypothetical protein